MKNKGRVFFITGTDTGVGKTICSLLFMQYSYSIECKPFYIKPFQTGCIGPDDKDSDAAFIYANTKELQNVNPADSVLYCYRNPKAPYFAALDEWCEITQKELSHVVEIIKKRSVEYDPVIVEGAGGLLVPVTESVMMIDLMRMLNASPVIAAKAGLGTINHTLLSLSLLQSQNIIPAGIILCDADAKPAPETMIRENILAIEKYSGCKVNGVIGKIINFSDMKSYFKIVEDILK